MGVPVPILMYHSVDADCAPAYRHWTVSPARFAEHMAVLRDRGRTPLTIAELVERIQAGRLPAGAVAITFDDGLGDFARFALPVLEEFEFPSTLFVTTGYVGETSRWLAELGEGARPMLTWSEIDDLADRDVEIGAHTHTHPQLDLLDLDAARWEIETSKELIEMHTGMPVRSFAYPHGYSTPDVRELVVRAGFTAACRVADGVANTSESPYALSRVIVTERHTARNIEELLDGGLARRVPPPDRPAMVAWRYYRRARAALAGTQRLARVAAASPTEPPPPRDHQ